jgi:hypothetical protein
MAYKGRKEIRAENREKALALLAAGEKVPFSMQALVRDELNAQNREKALAKLAAGEKLGFSERALVKHELAEQEDKEASAARTVASLVEANQADRERAAELSAPPLNDQAVTPSNAADLGQELDEYDVIYLGGLPSYPSKKVGKVNLIIRSSGFELRPTSTTRSWFAGLAMPYSGVDDLTIEQRQVSTFEAFAGGLNSRQLNQANNIHITMHTPNGLLVLRLEMLTGFTVMGQAKKCREFTDRLLTLGIRNQFRASLPPAQQPTADNWAF